MSNPAPDFDPYFVPEADNPKGKAKGTGSPPGDDAIRRDLLPTEAAFRVAGTTAMILGASVFVVFAVPVSSMLRHADGPDGLLVDEDWLFRRWVARMTTALTLAVLASLMGSGLRRRRPWARVALIGLGGVPILALIAGLVLRATGMGQAVREFSDALVLPCVGAIVYPASLAAFWAAFSRRCRAVFDPDYDDLIARTPKLTPRLRTGLWGGLGLAWALLILFWMLTFSILGVLAVRGVIRSV